MEQQISMKQINQRLKVEYCFRVAAFNQSNSLVSVIIVTTLVTTGKAIVAITIIAEAIAATIIIAKLVSLFLDSP